jgi:hypothetical protein
MTSEQIFQKSKGHLKILGARWVAWSKFLTEDLQILGTTLRDLVTQLTWHLGFVHPWIR